MNIEDLDRFSTDLYTGQDEVIISFGAFEGIDEIHKLDLLLFEKIPTEIGRYDGHEVNMDDTDGRLFAYGKNAEALFKVMQPILNDFEFLYDAQVYLRFVNEGKEDSELEFNLN